MAFTSMEIVIRLGSLYMKLLLQGATSLLQDTISVGDILSFVFAIIQIK